VLLGEVECFVRDEADRMLDQGFIHAIRRIVPMLPTARQTMLFSATMPAAISALAAELLRDPVQLAVAPQATTAERVTDRVS
jgi:ATP-dependent RNA helicase RhlE